MWKKVLSLLLAAALLLTLVPQLTLPAAAAETSGKCGDNATWSFNASTGTLTISGSGTVNTADLMMMKLWAPYLDQIRTVVVNNGITEIMAYAFANCPNLQSVSLPNTLTSLSDLVFAYCPSLKSISLPDSITNMGGGVFVECTSLTSLRFPSKLKTVWSQIAMGCTSLTSVTLPPNTTTIMTRAFMDCVKLTSIQIPSSVETIEADAFRNTGIYNTERNWSGNVLCIGPWAVAGKPDAKQLQIKAGTKYIAKSAFDGIQTLTKAELPESLVRIGSGAFAGCTALKEVSVPEGVRTIESYAFSGCDALTLTVMNPNCSIEQDTHTLGTAGKTVIRGYAGSTAQSYAEKYKYSFVVPTFLDVLDSAFYAKAVTWAVDNGVTKGTAPGKFSPNDTCTRGQVVTFLHRAVGSPKPEGTENPFTDVKSGAFYYKSVLWAVANKITSGMTKTTFEPDGSCTRGQVVTFLWRAKGCPEPESQDNPFTDVKPGAFYYKAVLWAVENKITNGMSKTAFAPNATCTRGQIVTFLYRAMNG